MELPEPAYQLYVTKNAHYDEPHETLAEFLKDDWYEDMQPADRGGMYSHQHALDTTVVPKNADQFLCRARANA